MRARALIQIDFGGKECARGAFEALKPETRRPITPRSKAMIRLEGKHVVLEFSARDSTALRASLNSYLRWALGVKEIFSILKSR